jgi:PPIC-type PPIASE domain
VKRLVSGTATVLVVLAAGLAVSACNVVPYAASANGTTISVTELNGELHSLQSTAAGACLEEIENPASAAPGQGTGGAGTYTMTYADAVLESRLANLLAGQYATSKGIALSSSDLSTAKTDLESMLDGAISTQVQQASTSGTTSNCQLSGGATMTGAQLLAALPSGVSNDRIRNQAVDERLLSNGASISDQDIAAYYAANLPLFTLDCVSLIATNTQAAAEQIVSQLDGGANFADLARSSSIDQTTAANGGQVGCDIAEAQVKQALSLQNVAVGSPIAPVQDPNTGEWVVYEVTSQAVEPLSQARTLARRELLQATTNVNRVNAEVLAFARHSDVSVNPQYGSWKTLTVVAPVSPPPQYLLSASGGSAAGGG